MCIFSLILIFSPVRGYPKYTTKRLKTKYRNSHKKRRDQERKQVFVFVPVFSKAYD